MPISPNQLNKRVKEEIIRIKKIEEKDVIYFTTSIAVTEDKKTEYYALLLFKTRNSKLNFLKENYLGIWSAYNCSSGQLIGVIENIETKKGKLKEIIKEAITKESEKRNRLIVNLSEKEVKEINNILLIGRTGDGKSALANLLVTEKEEKDKDGNYKWPFKESESSVSETEVIKSEPFEHNKVKFRIIDTPGINHTKLLREEILSQIIQEIAYSCSSNLRQVLFVTSNKLTKEEIEAYNILKEVIFDENITKYVTIVRTNFPNYMRAENSAVDLHKIGMGHHNTSGKIECKKIIYIDNPPLDITKISPESISNDQIVKMFKLENKTFESEKQEWQKRVENKQCIHCNCNDRELNHNYCNTPNLRYCLICHEKLSRHVTKMYDETIRINKVIRSFSREKILKSLEECLKEEPYTAGERLKNLNNRIGDLVVKISILEEIIKKRLVELNLSPEKKEPLESVCKELKKELESSVYQEVTNYIEKKDLTGGSLFSGQIKEKWPEITTTILDNSGQFIGQLAPPASWAVSGTLAIVSGLIKTYWLKS